MKYYSYIILLALVLGPVPLWAGNRELVKQPERHYTVDDNGEIILKMKKADWVYDCKDCHKDFSTRTEARELVSEHGNLHYDHINGREWCFVCHYRDLDKRNRIKMPFGKGIYSGPQDMIAICIQCHGKKAAEWEIGLHGKVKGSWITYGEAEREKLTCDKCHSPHHPRSIPVPPLPAPKSRHHENVQKDH